ncbi:MAG: formylglycine-generating enzyme family protein [Victivallales bacterium]|nr:formylglycine-generating enzyme family protein [Victivallales bacterium]
MNKKLILVFALFLFRSLCFAQVKVSDVSFTTRWPWNELVDITFTIGGIDIEGKKYSLVFEGYDNVTQKSVTMKSITGVGWTYGSPVHSGTLYAVWNAGVDCPTFHSASFQIKVTATQVEALDNPYLVIDLSAGPNAPYYPYELRSSGPKPEELLGQTTFQLWLFRTPAGRFMMGSPESEVGRHSNERQHIVYITKPFYTGIYEITQKQWELVMGSNPSKHIGDSRPVENVSYDMIRGARNGSEWPTGLYAADTSSFIGRIQARTGLTLDLPTEAQWEFACRAGTTGYLNNGNFQIIEKFRYYNDNSRFIYLFDADSKAKSEYNISLLSSVARWDYNKEDGKGAYTQHTMVGLYNVNGFGFYDMHGNVYEWCLDWHDPFTALEVVNPTGPSSGTERICRGGSWKESDCDKFRSAFRAKHKSDYTSSDLGFRIIWHRVN